MKKALILLFTLTSLVATWGSIVIQDMSVYCPLTADGVKLKNVQNENSYFECENDKAIEKFCPTNEIFQKDEQKCIALGDAACVGLDDDHVTGPKCSWIYCLNEKATGTGYCPLKQHFNGTECVYGNCPGTGSENGEMEIKSICDIMPNTKFFGDTSSCANWCKCSKDNEFKNDECPATQFFDAKGQQCVYDKNVCSRITNEEIIPDIDGAVSNYCENNNKIDGFYADPDNCSKYYECVDQITTVKVCKDSKHYQPDANDETAEGLCESRFVAITINGCDRCQSTDMQFVTDTSDSTCVTYAICKNKKKDTTGKCSDDESIYFDEKSGACIKGELGELQTDFFGCVPSP